MARITIVDDDEDFAAAAASVLRAAGHQVDVWHDPQAALPAMTLSKPDLIVLDVMFPESVSGGFDLARRIATAEPSLKNVPILMLTAVNSRFPLGFTSRDIDTEWLPVADFVEKPVDLATLPGRVNGLLAKAAGGGR